jgi:IS1 family transposase
VLPPDKLVQSKAGTHRIERNHCRQRHCSGRCKRLSLIVPMVPSYCTSLQAAWE